MNITPRLQRILSDSARIAAGLDNRYIGVEHVFLAILREGNSSAAVYLATKEVSAAEFEHHLGFEQPLDFQI